MREKKKITAGIDVNLTKSDILYHIIRGFINMRQGETGSNEAFKLHFENIYKTTELANRENILLSKKITKNGSQASIKEKNHIFSR